MSRIIKSGLIQAHNHAPTDAPIAEIKKITVTDNILYEYQSQQMGLLHITVNGKRQSTKLVNPEDKVEMSF